MKKFKLFIMALVAMTGVFTFAACGDDDDNGNNQSDTYASTYNFGFVVNQELLDVADITISYTGTDGVEKTETMTTTKWTKTNDKANKFGTSVKLKITMALKDGVTLDKEEYTVAYGLNYYIYSEKNGGVIDFKGIPSDMSDITPSISKGVSKDKLAKALTNIEQTYSIGTDGIVSIN